MILLVRIVGHLFLLIALGGVAGNAGLGMILE